MTLALGVIAPYTDTMITSGSVLTDFCGMLEEVGVESLWTVEHVIEAEEYELLYPSNDSGRMPGRFVPMADPLEILTFAAGVSMSLKLGTGVMVEPLHPPVVLAKRAATLDRLSGINAGVTTPDQMPLLRERIRRYQDQVIEPLDRLAVR